MRHLYFILLVACAGTQAAQPVQESMESDVFSLPPSAAENAPQVELMNAGVEGEPQLLRFHLQVGYTQRMVVSTTMRMAINMGTPVPAVEMPTSHMVFALRVTDTNAEGLSRLELLLEEVRVDPGPHSAAMAAELQPLQGLTGVEIMDARGRTLYLSYDIPDGVSDTTRASMERMQDVMKQVKPPFPAEPVAVGARWRVESEIHNQVVIQQVQEFELVERDGDRIVLRTTTMQSAQPQPMVVPQPGVSARLISLSGEGTGRSEINLTQLAATSQADVGVELESEITPDGDHDHDDADSLGNIASIVRGSSMKKDAKVY